MLEAYAYCKSLTLPNNTTMDFRHKFIRDPLYGFIGLSETETRLIDTPLFRRLQFIKQLSHAFVVYPSAIHTRFEHSLGCMHVAGKICDELGFDLQDKEDVRIAALLHDIGHGPFSHLFEAVMSRCNPNIDNPHERISEIMIMENRDIDEILGDRKQTITDLLQKRIDSTASDIVSGSMDADKLDYMLRDSYHIGVSYGKFDLDRILHTLRRHPQDTALCVDVKGKDALENYRLARHLLHAQVYHHHARLVADQMFLKALEMALDDDIVRADDLKIMQGDNSHFLDFYSSLDDNSIYDLIIRHPNAGLSKEILQNIRHRRLLKRACDFTTKELSQNADVCEKLLETTPPELDDMSARIAARLGLRPHEVIFYKSFIPIKLYNKDPILLMRKKSVLNLSDYSPFTSADSVIRYLVYGPADAGVRKTIAAEVARELHVDASAISELE